MRKILSLLAVLSIMAPAGVATAHHDTKYKRKYAKQNNNNQSRSTRSYRNGGSTAAEKAQRAYIDHYYSDYPAWAGLAFSPRGRNR